MFVNRRLKHVVTLFLSPFLISGLFLHPAIITFSHAASNITSDGTMGTTITQAGTIYNIDNGTIREANQFHSFGLFSVGTGDTASFNGPGTIANIIGRVTGGQQSVIDGILKSTITGANLYLLNPYGVLFGKNASLNVSGSFHVSTADYLRLSDGGIFYSNPLSSSVLTTAAPAAFGFLSNNAAPIDIQGSFLQVPKGNILSVIGGDINITNQSPGYLYAPCGQINLVSGASPGEVNLSDFSTSSFSKLGNITIFQPSWNAGGIYADGSNYNVDPGGTIIIRGGKIFFENTNLYARGNPGGTLRINGEQLHLDDTYINTGTRGAVNHPGTGVDINVTGDVLLTNGSEIASSSVGAGRAGDIRITAGNIQLGDDDPTKSLYSSTGFYGDIGSRAFGSGRGGDVYITADNLTIKNGFFINTAAQSLGDAGNVTVRANSLKLLDEGSISSNGNWVGKGGIVDVVADDVFISAQNRSNVLNYTGLTGLAAQAGYGSKGGLLRLNADTLQILDGGSISTVLYSTGPGADIEITAKNILISGVVIDNRISPPDIHASIDARVIGTYASGTGGNISVVADSLQITNGGFIASSLSGNAPGNAGNITIKTGGLELSDGGKIAASSVFGTGNAGRLDITANDVHITGVNSSSDPFGKDFTGFSTATNAGLGGDLTLTTNSLLLTDRAAINASSYGPGRSGNLISNVGMVQVLNGSAIASNAYGSGDGGKVDIKSDSVLVSGVHPDVITDTSGYKSLAISGIVSEALTKGGNAGDVRISAGSLQVMDGGRIATDTYGRGNGGTIQITADTVLISGVNAALREFLIANGGDPRWASSALLSMSHSNLLGDNATGNAGNIKITAGTFEVKNGLISSATNTPGTGGTIEIVADRVSLSSDAFISARSNSSNASNAGKAGDILITAHDTFKNDNSTLITAADQGKGGDITLQANTVLLTNGALISAESSGVGDAGNINIDVADALRMENSSVTTEAKQADGGNIRIGAGYMVSLIDSRISASVGGGPDTVGGNITIDPQYVILNDSQIIANAYEGRGGNIRIIADVFLASPESIVDASSTLGIDGTVDIRAPITSISGTLVPMQGNFLSAEALLRDRCAAKIRGEKYSSFFVSGRDGLPVRPGSVLPSPIY